MEKSFQGFLESSLLWSGRQFDLDQFVIKYGILDQSRLLPIPKRLRLGHQVEHIFMELLKVSNHYKVLAHSIQLVEFKQTLGELDFIVKSLNDDKIIHIELAYKFYLLDPNMDGVVQGLVGPNRGDAFTYKLDKTKNKQLPLLYTDAAKERLNINVDEVIQKVAFYGEIYTPYQMEIQDFGVLNTDCIKGYYMPLERFELEHFKSYKFHFPSKSEWIHIPHFNVKWMNFETAIKTIRERHATYRSPMIWLRNDANELVKIFVTHW